MVAISSPRASVDHDRWKSLRVDEFLVSQQLCLPDVQAEAKIAVKIASTVTNACNGHPLDMLLLSFSP